MFELPDDLSKEDLRKQLKQTNKDWKAELKNKGFENEREYAFEQLKNYKAHIKDYLNTNTFKKEREVLDNKPASDEFTPEELKRELNLEDLQTKFLKETNSKNKKEA